MPLAFESASHGVVAFGFFNIDSDMLLLEQQFFFADDFCRAMVRLAAAGADDEVVEWDGYHIEDRAEVGDLMGAIHGARFSGFIGETYKRFPFPERREDFVQKPEGEDNRAVFAEMIEPFAVARTMRVEGDRERERVTIAGYGFARAEFHRLIDYVWFGGYPRWREGVRPACVERLAAAVGSSEHWIFDGIELSG